MKNFWKIVFGTVVGIILFLMINFILLLVIAGVASSSSTTTLSSHSVYKLDLDGVLKERITDNPLNDIFSSMPSNSMYSKPSEIGLDDILSNIKLAKENENIDGIYLKGGSLSMGPASAQQIRKALLDFKQSGKWIVAYSDSYGMSNYYVASVADKLCLNSNGSLSWHGMSASVGFYKGVMDKVGVEMQVFKVGTFKSAVEPYITDKMSDANRLQMNVLLNDVWSEMNAAVAESRGLTTDQLNLLSDRYMDLEPETEYVECGLVDTLLYAQDVDTLLAALTGTKDFKFVSHKSMNNVPRKTKYIADKVAVIYAEGEITDDSGDGIVGTKMVKAINEIVKEDDVKAVVLRVNSPGGSAYASEQIWHAMTLLKQKGLPVVVSMGDYAASGGYYISCMADSIVAEPTTLTGSIGIFGLLPNVRGLIGKVGYSVDGVATHKNGMFDLNATYGTLTAEQKQQMQLAIERGYDLFTRRCADGRHMSQDSLKLIAEGRVWSGVRALEIGLVDKLGSLDDAIAMAANMANLEKYDVRKYPELEDIYTQLLSGSAADEMADRIIAKRLGYGYQEYMQINSVINKSGIRAEMPQISIY